MNARTAIPQEIHASQDAADRRCKSYSGGMVRKLDIAMSLIGTPRVIDRGLDTGNSGA